MRIFIIDHLKDQIINHFIDDNVTIRSDLQLKNPKFIARALIGGDADAVISMQPIAPETLTEWGLAHGKSHYCIRIEIDPSIETTSVSDTVKSEQLSSFTVSAKDQAEAYRAAFEALEKLFVTQELFKPAATGWQPVRAVNGKSQKSEPILLVGAGLVNVITGYELQRAGYDVHFVDAGPDPRDAAHWHAYGCTHGGDDARMFTLSEMDNYNDKTLSPVMNRIFSETVTQLGWNVHWADSLSQPEKNWIGEFERIPVWLAQAYNKDIFSFNRESLPLWNRLIAEEAALFRQSMHRDGILRLYSDPEQYDAALARQNRIGATLKALSPDQVAQEHPALAEAVRGGHIAGGVFVVGFTVNIHKFMRGMIERLEQAGARFTWNQPAQKLVFDSDGAIKGLRTASGMLEAHHYVLSPGAYGDALLAGTCSQGKIHGVLGAWLRLPNVEPQLAHSLKLARKNHITEDSNITVATDEKGEPLMIIGSGYGHTGTDPRNIDEALLRQIYDGLIDTAKHYFPQAHALAAERGLLESSLKYCVRPWTSTGLGVFEMVPTRRQGRCVITGGHNTGGFAQAPAIAKAVLAAVSGAHHPMHALYHPDRAAAFLGNPMPNGRRDMADPSRLRAAAI